MWYVAAVIMAQKKSPRKRRYLCESCNVLLTADGADDAYRKAVTWGVNYESESLYSLVFLGVEVLCEIGESIDDGVQMSGCFFQKMDVWNRRKKFIPPPEDLSAIRIARNMNTPIGDLMTPHQIQLMREGFRGQS